MIQGTSSSAGKSLLTAGLCRIYARRSYRVAPFKAQNMALNSYVTPDGLEIGRAQALQAFAAGTEIDYRMNPVLLKPEGNACSQLIVNGRLSGRIHAGEYWRERSVLWPHVTQALDSLRADFDLVFMEGAGSPAEINLKASDIVNMAPARHAGAPILLVGDIDRGGVFASFVGTLALMDPDERKLFAGFVINKFRGDLGLLQDGLCMLQEKTGLPTLGVVPWIQDLLLAEEDSVALDSALRSSRGQRFSSFSSGKKTGTVEILVPRFPRISNFDDLDALAMEEGVKLRFCTRAEDFGEPDAVLLCGTKSVVADLLWLKNSGLEQKIREYSAPGSRRVFSVIGICGGYQMLGSSLNDNEAADGMPTASSPVPALGLLGHRTVFSGTKQLTRRSVLLAQGPGPFAEAAGARITGYEVHMGFHEQCSDIPLFADDTGCLGSRTADGRIWGTYLHGVFDEAPFRRAWLRSLGWKAAGPGQSLHARREAELDRLADAVEAALDMAAVDRLLGLS